MNVLPNQRLLPVVLRYVSRIAGMAGAALGLTLAGCATAKPPMEVHLAIGVPSPGDSDYALLWAMQSSDQNTPASSQKPTASAATKTH